MRRRYVTRHDVHDRATAAYLRVALAGIKDRHDSQTKGMRVIGRTPPAVRVDEETGAVYLESTTLVRESE